MSTNGRPSYPPPAPMRLALRKEEAARALGISDETFDQYVKPHVPVVRLGRVRLYPVPGLRAYLAEHQAVPLDSVGAGNATG